MPAGRIRRRCSAPGAAAALVLLSSCALRSTTPGTTAVQTVRGVLDASDAQLSGGEFVDYYRFHVAPGARLAITLKSEGFDGYLIAYRPGPLRLFNDDFEGSTELSRINHAVEEDGPWLVAVTSAAAGEAGAYELTIDGANSRGDSARAITSLSREWAVRFLDAYRAQLPANQIADLTESITSLAQASRTLEELGLAELSASTMVFIALRLRDAGAPDSARAWALEAMRVAQDGGAPRGAADALRSLAETALATGDVVRASDLYQQALLLRQAHGTRAAERLLLNDLGRLHARAGRPDSALAYHTRALEIERERDDPGSLGATLLLIGHQEAALGAADAALASYQEALRIAVEADSPPDEIEPLIALASVHTDVDTIDAFHDRAVELARSLGNPLIEAATLERVGNERAQMGQRDTALALLRAALAIREREQLEHSLTSVLTSLGSVHDDIGNADSALVHYARALELQRAMEDPWGESETLNLIGYVHYGMGRADSAEAIHRRALNISRAIRDRAEERTSLNYIGFTHSARGAPDSAMLYHRNALAIALELGLDDTIYQEISHIGTVYADLGRPDSALAYYQRARALLHEDRQGPWLAATLQRIASVLYDTGATDSARAYYAQALTLARASSDPFTEALVLNNLGTIHRRIEPVDPARAAAYYDSAAVVVARLRGSTGDDANRIGFAEQHTYLPNNWARAWLGRSAEVGERTSRAAALAAIERGRAQGLLDLMRGTREIVAGSDLAAEADAVLDPIRATGSYTLSYALAVDTLMMWLTHPDGAIDVHRRGVSDTALGGRIAALRQNLNVDSAAARAVGVALEPEGDEGPGVHARRGAAGYAVLLRELATIVLPDELTERVPAGADLVIVPDASLSLLPFAALPAGDAPLGSRYRLRYAPSLAALAEAEARPRTASAGARKTLNALVVGNPSMPEVIAENGARVQLSSLAGAEREARAVAAALGSALLSGSKATEAAVLRLMGDAAVIHLATHGYAYATESRARDSFIALAPDAAGDGPSTDGLLTVGEVLESVPELNAELVVLSACQTGLGDRNAAEGTVGLQRAFLARGARTVLVSLWSVDDRVTELLMSRFYEHWTSGASKAEALRLAQDDVRSEYPNPRYWAAFQLVGAQ